MFVGRDRGSRRPCSLGEFILAEAGLDSRPFEKVHVHDPKGIRSDTPSDPDTLARAIVELGGIEPPSIRR